MTTTHRKSDDMNEPERAARISDLMEALEHIKSTYGDLELARPAEVDGETDHDILWVSEAGNVLNLVDAISKPMGCGEVTSDGKPVMIFVPGDFLVVG